VGRSAFEHAYDDLATSALRFLAEAAGPDAVAEFARRQVADLERRYGPVVQGAPAADRVAALAEALSADGYAASASGAPSPGTSADPGPGAGGASNCASITARWRTWPPSSPSCARRRRRRSPGSSAPPCSG